MMFALWSSATHIPIKSKGPMKKMSHLRPIYLTPTSYRLRNTQLVWDDYRFQIVPIGCSPRRFWSSYSLSKWTFFVDIKWSYRSSLHPNLVYYWARIAHVSWARSPISFKHVSILCSFLHPHLTTHHSNIVVQAKKPWMVHLTVGRRSILLIESH